MESTQGARSPFPWSCMIVPARYCGIYEGGRWLAFHADSFHDYSIPFHVAFGDDEAASEWWGDNGQSENAELVGRGATPNEALADLLKRRNLKQ